MKNTSKPTKSNKPKESRQKKLQRGMALFLALLTILSLVFVACDTVSAVTMEEYEISEITGVNNWQPAPGTLGWFVQFVLVGILGGIVGAAAVLAFMYGSVIFIRIRDKLFGKSATVTAHTCKCGNHVHDENHVCKCGADGCKCKDNQ